MGIVAERAFTSRMTVHRIEAGDPSVGIGIYAAVLQALGLLEEFGRGVGPSEDHVGQGLASDALPNRIRLRRRPAASIDA